MPGTSPEAVIPAATASEVSGALQPEPQTTWPFRPLDAGFSKTVFIFLRLTSGLYLALGGVSFMFALNYNSEQGGQEPLIPTSIDLGAIAGWILTMAYLMFLVTGVLFVTWFFQAYKSAQSRGAKQRKWGAGWTIGGWFVPAAQWVIPKLVMNEVDRMSQPAAGQSPIENRWRKLPVNESSTIWWGLFVAGMFGGLALARLPADIEPMRRASLDGAWALTMGFAGVAGSNVVKAIGERLAEPPDAMIRNVDPVNNTISELQDLFDASPFTWIRGYEVKVTREQRLRCLTCDQDVYFPAGRKRHRTHRIAPVGTDATKRQPVKNDDNTVDIESIGAKHLALTPDDPIGAANRAHVDRLAYADRLYAEGRFTTTQLNTFRATSQVELDRDIAEANRSG